MSDKGEMDSNSNMNFLKSLGRNIKNVFVGSHRGEDFILENLQEIEKKKEMPEPEKSNNNDMGVDPNEWFHNDEPLDLAPSEYEPPMTEDDWFIDKPKEKKEEDITMHEKMYRIATARYNPFGLGGSENCDSDVSCNSLGGGSETIQK